MSDGLVMNEPAQMWKLWLMLIGLFFILAMAFSGGKFLSWLADLFS